MTRFALSLIVAVMVVAGAGRFTMGEAETAGLNTLTAAEKADGWKLLWDGKTTEGWRSYKEEKFPEKGWEIVDGTLACGDKSGGGDIVTKETYGSFELKAEFKMVAGTNSGIKVFIDPAAPKKLLNVGLEYQILDDGNHPDAKGGTNGNHTLGSLYDLIPAPKDKVTKPIGEWNTARIVSKGKHLEFWLNGTKTIETERGSDEFHALVAKSKFKSIPNFAEMEKGRILLQDHNTAVAFRNLKIKELDGK